LASNRFGDLVRFAIVVAVCASGSFADAADDCLPLEPRSPHGNYLVPGGRGDIVYRRASTRDEGAGLALDAYRQPGNQRHPAVVVVHGGGGAGSRVSFVGQLIETITAAGYQWVSIDYTPGLANGDRAVDDVIAAVAFVRCHAEALGIQPTRIALLGEDTGADLVTRAAARDPSIAAVVLIGGAFGADVGPRSARSLVIHGGADSEVPLSRGETWCTVKAAASCDLIAVAGASHRVENWHPAQWSYKPRLVDWLHRVLGPGASVSREVVSARNTDATPFGHGLLKNIPYDAPLGLALDAWLPSSAAPSPAVILVHGGGWEAGDKVTYITPLFEPLARAGFAWFSIDYRLTPAVPHPAQMDDLRHAVAFIRRHASRFRVDPQRLVVIGESASGQMAALLATEDSQLAGVVSFYGVYDFFPFATSLTARSLPTRLFGITSINASAAALLRRNSPISHVRRDIPPMLLVHGTADELWRQGQAMAGALATVGARHELYALEGAPHGMENWEGRPEWERYKARVVAFIREVTQPE
jgi:acetyl esterase